MEDLVEFAVHYAEKLGVEYAEARLQESASQLLVLKNGELEVAGISKSTGIGVRVVANGGLGFIAFNVPTKASVKRNVMQAVRMAKASASFNKEPIVFSEEKVFEKKWKVKPKLPFEDVPVEEKVSLLMDLDKAALVSATQVSLPHRMFEMIGSTTKKYFVNSHGAKIVSEVPRVYVEWVLTARTAGDTEQEMLWKGESRGWEAVREWKLLERVEERVKVLSKILTSAKAPPHGKIGMIIGNEVMGLVVHESVGHPYEADRVLGREAAQAGESFVTPDMIGQRIGSEVVTVVDDPTLKHSYGYYEFDDEGVKAKRRTLLREGVINELLHNRQTASKLGVSSNGAARASSFDREPLVRMANTFMLPGDHEFEELLEGVKLGIYMKTYGECNIDDRRWNMRFVGRECYLIHNGRIGEMVRRPVLEITTPTFYSSIDAVDKHLHFDAATCGKGDPMQPMPVWCGGPNVRLRGVRL